MAFFSAAGLLTITALAICYELSSAAGISPLRSVLAASEDNNELSRVSILLFLTA
jgi:hypothetical protein